MKKLELTEAQIRAHATEKVFERGVDYERKGLVSALVWRGGELQAEVRGSEPTPYRVRVAFEEDGTPRSARCSCPYDWGGWCKHIVAVLLAVLRAPERVEERPALEEMLGRLDATALRELLLDLAARRPRLVEEIESRLALQEAETTPADSRAVDVRRCAAAYRPSCIRWITSHLRGRTGRSAVWSRTCARCLGRSRPS